MNGDDSVGDAIGDDSMSSSSSTEDDFGGSAGGGDGSNDDGSADGSAGGVGDAVDSGGLLSSEDILKRGRELALLGVPLQVSNLFEAIAQLRARASGSTAEIFPAIIGQLSELRGQYAGASQAIARRLGFAGGGQVKREQGKALASASQRYGGLLVKDQTACFANLINTLSGLQPALSGAARPPNVSTKDVPQDFSQQGAGIASMISAARKLEDFYKNRQSPVGAQPYPNLPSTSEATLFGATP